VSEPSPGRASPPDDASPPSEAAAPPPPRPGLSDRAKATAGAFIAVLYALGMGLRGDLLPGVVGGVLAGVLCFLVLREVEQRRRRRS
jgi:predicted lipid-binding transport protein (Tim44 family)